MIGRMRTAAAALVGALCGAGWFWSLEPSSELVCHLDGPDSGLACIFPLFLLVMPALVIVWAVVGWGLLRLVRYSPAWPTAGGGTAGAALLLLISVFILQFVRLQLPEDSGIFVAALAGAAGYALAAEVTARYGGRRDRAEHRGQDG